MRKYLLQVIKECWLLPVFEYYKMRDLFKRILTVYNILEVFELTSKNTIALYGRNSYNWIAIYLAGILKGVRIVILHPNVDPLEAVHVMLMTNVNHLFIDDDLISEPLGKNIFLKTLISTQTLKVVFERNDKTYFKALAEIIVSSENTLNLEIRGVKAVDETIKETGDECIIITATSGTENAFPKWVESKADSVLNLLKKAIAVVPYDSMQRVFANLEFAESHYLTVLLPFAKGCVFVGSKEKADVVIESSPSLESIWRDNVSYLYGNKLLSFLFSKTWLKIFFKRLALLRIGRYYGKKVKKLIIYNAVVNEEILITLASKFPIYTTYGSQETNQLVAINDFSSKEKRLPNCAGRVIPGLVITITDGEIEVSGTSLFDNYVGDDEYTREVRFRDNYITGDMGSVDPNDLLFVIGRKSAISHSDLKLPMQLDKVERILRSIPYVKELVLFLDKETRRLILLVYPDINFVETKGIGLIQLETLMQMYLSKINQNLNESMKISKLIVSPKPLAKTQDGKVCRYYYS